LWIISTPWAAETRDSVARIPRATRIVHIFVRHHLYLSFLKWHRGLYYERIGAVYLQYEDKLLKGLYDLIGFVLT
jgi:hypothetical protein